MRENQIPYSGATLKIMTLLAALGLMLSLGCTERNSDGVFLILELDNTENVKQYSVFNPYIHSIDECKSTADAAIEHILSSEHRVVPKDTKVRSWRCSMLPPDRGG
jgi:hypothetical protein